jgi:hypothetical protein
MGAISGAGHCKRASADRPGSYRTFENRPRLATSLPGLMRDHWLEGRVNDECGDVLRISCRCLAGVREWPA